MCGRFVSSSNADDIAKYFDVGQVSEQALGHKPNYNTAPTTDVFVVYLDGTIRSLDTFHWGLVPRWAKDLKIGNKLINARAETVAEKPAFRSAYAKRRCIMPVDGFYEWNKPEGAKRKQPWFIQRPDGEPYAFAGLWEEWRGKLPSAAGTSDSGEAASEASAETTIRSSTIITGSPNDKMVEIHHRMPVILPASAWDEWLDPNTDIARVGALLVPAPSELITFHPVSTEVNNVRHNGPELTQAIDLDTQLDPDAPPDLDTPLDLD